MVDVHESIPHKTNEENTDVTILAACNLKDERNPQNTQGIFGNILKVILFLSSIQQFKSILFFYKFYSPFYPDKTNEHSVRIAIENGRECDEKIKAVRITDSTLSKIRKRLNPISKQYQCFSHFIGPLRITTIIEQALCRMIYWSLDYNDMRLSQNGISSKLRSIV